MAQTLGRRRSGSPGPDDFGRQMSAAPATVMERRPSAMPSMVGGHKVSKGGVKVMVRVRPFNSREKAISADKDETLRCIVEFDGGKCTVLDHTKDYDPRDGLPACMFDECLWSLDPNDEENPVPEKNGFCDQKMVYEKGGREALDNAWDGYNTCIFAYGQTGAGKSFSMLGAPGLPGIAPQLIDDLFIHITEQKEVNKQTLWKVEVSFFEIYMEKVKDLFKKKPADGGEEEFSEPKVMQHPLYGMQVQGLETLQVTTSKECNHEMEHGASSRALASTKMNATSSRSHAIFQIHITQNEVKAKSKTNATINLVDLAGSERIGKTGATGQTRDEGMKINASLSTLRKVIDALVDMSKGKKGVHPPYRDSMLTKVLKESLGGNSKTVMITAISPHYDNVEDTISTLRYGLKAKTIVNKAIKQEVSGKKLEFQLKNQIEELERKLQEAMSPDGAGGTGITEEEKAAIEEEKFMLIRAAEQVQAEKLQIEEREHELMVINQEQRKKAFAQAFRSAFAVRKTQEGNQALEAHNQQLVHKQKQMEEDRLAMLEKHSKEAQALNEALGKAQDDAHGQRAERQKLEEQGRAMAAEHAEATRQAQEKERSITQAAEDAAEAAMREEMVLQQQMRAAATEEDRFRERVCAELTPPGGAPPDDDGAPDSPMSGRNRVLRRAAALQERARGSEARVRELEDETRRLRDASERAAVEAQRREESVAAQRRDEEKHQREARTRIEQRADESVRLMEDRVRDALQDRMDLENQLEETRRKYETLSDQFRQMQQAHQAARERQEEEMREEQQRHETALLWVQHRKEHYKELSVHLKGVHDADTRIIESLRGECMSASSVASSRRELGRLSRARRDVNSSPHRLAARAAAAEAALDGKGDAVAQLGDALVDYQDAMTRARNLSGASANGSSPAASTSRAARLHTQPERRGYSSIERALEERRNDDTAASDDLDAPVQVPVQPLWQPPHRGSGRDRGRRRADPGDRAAAAAWALSPRELADGFRHSAFGFGNSPGDPRGAPRRSHRARSPPHSAARAALRDYGPDRDRDLDRIDLV